MINSFDWLEDTLTSTSILSSNPTRSARGVGEIGITGMPAAKPTGLQRHRKENPTRSPFDLKICFRQRPGSQQFPKISQPVAGAGTRK
jgi:hypothetical protein